MFSCVYQPSVCLWRNVCFNFLIGWFVFLFLSYMSCLYILNSNPLSVVSFAIIFSHSEDCLFTFFIISFAVQKLFSLIRSHLFILVFISSTLEVGSQRICCDLCQSVLCLYFPLRVLQFFIFMFRSLIQLEFLFVFFEFSELVQYVKYLYLSILSSYR